MGDFVERPYSRKVFQLTVGYTLTAIVESWNLYTVPADTDLFIDLITAQNGTSSTGLFNLIYTLGGNTYRLGGLATFTRYLNNYFPAKCYIPSGAVITASVRAGTIGDVINTTLVGTELIAGQWI